MSRADEPVEPPDDGGVRPSPSPRPATGEENETAAAQRPVGDFGDEERADPGGDSDAEPVEPGRD